MITLLLLVPLTYSAFATNEACALPPDPKFGQNSSCKLDPQGEWKTCCWFTGDGLGMTCQQCFKDENGKYSICGSTWDIQARKGLGPGEIVPDTGEPTIKDPPTTTEPKVPKGGLDDGADLTQGDTSDDNDDTEVPEDRGGLNDDDDGPPAINPGQ